MSEQADRIRRLIVAASSEPMRIEAHRDRVDVVVGAGPRACLLTVEPSEEQFATLLVILHREVPGILDALEQAHRDRDAARVETERVLAATTDKLAAVNSAVEHVVSLHIETIAEQAVELDGMRKLETECAELEEEIEPARAVVLAARAWKRDRYSPRLVAAVEEYEKCLSGASSESQS